MRTVSAKSKDIQRDWITMDATDQVLGRLASNVASILRGKHKPLFTPHVDTGDHVVVINASKVRLTGRKLIQKIYHRHSGYPGGLRSTTAGRLLKERPERLIQFAVAGMLPKTKLGKAMIKKLKVYRGDTHPHQAQQPITKGPTKAGS
jgi:large subunit ribosomal protein L13